MRSHSTRVLVVTPYYAPAWRAGGTPVAIANWTEHLASEDFQMTVFTTTADGNHDLPRRTEKPLLRNGVSVEYFPRWRWTGNRLVSPSLVRAVYRRAREFDVIHAVNLWNVPSQSASGAARRYGIPYVISLNGTAMPWALGHHAWRKRLGRLLLENRALRGACKVVCTSVIEKRHFDALKLKTASVVIPCIVPLPQPREPAPEVRARLGVSTGPLVVFAGRIVRNKGLRFSIEAFSLTAARFPGSTFVVVGDAGDDSVPGLMKLAADRGIADRVLFAGHQERGALFDIVRSADVFVLHSLSENFANGVAEAMSLGVPVSVSDQVGIADLIAEYEAGVVSRLDSGDIANGLVEILASSPRRARMGQAGRRLVAERLGADVVRQQWQELFRETLRTASRGGAVRAKGQTIS